MRKIIINAFGPDKTGIVYQLSKIILGLNGNIENSKMIRMESDFAILMLVAISKNNISELENKLKEIKDFNLKTFLFFLFFVQPIMQLLNSHFIGKSQLIKS